MIKVGNNLAEAIYSGAYSQGNLPHNREFKIEALQKINNWLENLDYGKEGTILDELIEMWLDYFYEEN
jgi:hypothetical protein